MIAVYFTHVMIIKLSFYEMELLHLRMLILYLFKIFENPSMKHSTY